jgi:cytochrome d ubiquinol oxidase subunit I
MNALALARWQFAITTVYHFFFVPLTLGLSILVAIMETLYVRTGDETYKRMTKFWGKLFLINFAMGVVTGIVMEFQFGMNWADYSRFVGDVFGVPLAIEALLAFFLESTFLGIWIFGWDKLPKGVHAATIWLVAIGSNLSALWILIANSFMQEPVGYTLRNGRAEMTDFGALFRRSFRIALVYGLIGIALVGLLGHSQAQHMVQTQPMKMAAAEALWETEDPASLSLFTIVNERERRDVFAIRLPAMLSLLAYNRLDGEVKGINDLQAEYEQLYGPGDYVPPVTISYWAFRGMMTPGLLMGLAILLGLYLVLRGKLEHQSWFLRLLPWAILLPYLANSAGWILTEVGRQPWIVFGLMLVEEGVSPGVGAGLILFSLLAFTLIYGALMAVDVYLLLKYARKGATAEAESPAPAVS